MLSATPSGRASRSLRHPPVLVAALLLGSCLVIPRVAAQAPAQAPIVPDSAAASHVGQTVTVEGLVATVHVAPSGTIFLNFGRPYPSQTFTAVIFRSAAERFPNPRQWEGHRVRVTGEVRLYRGQPEIVLTAANQLQAAS